MDKVEPAGPLPGSARLEPAAGTARLSTILASAPGIAERLLRTTLESLPTVRVSGTAAGCLLALQMVRDREPDLVVIDANLPLEEVQEFLRLLRQEGRDTHCLVLAETTSQLCRALAAGADAALRWDASIQELRAALAELQRPHPRNAHKSNSDEPSTEG